MGNNQNYGSYGGIGGMAGQQPQGGNNAMYGYGGS